MGRRVGTCVRAHAFLSVCSSYLLARSIAFYSFCGLAFIFRERRRSPKKSSQYLSCKLSWTVVYHINPSPEKENSLIFRG